MTMKQFHEIIDMNDIVRIGYLSIEYGERFILPHYRDGYPVPVTEGVAREAYERFSGWCFVSEAPIGKIFRLYSKEGDPRHDTEVFDSEQLTRHGFSTEFIERVHAAGLRFFWHPVVSNSILIGIVRPDMEFFGVLEHYFVFENEPENMYCVMSYGDAVPISGLLKNLHGVPEWARGIPETILEIYDSLE